MPETRLDRKGFLKNLGVLAAAFAAKPVTRVSQRIRAAGAGTPAAAQGAPVAQKASQAVARTKPGA